MEIFMHIEPVNPNSVIYDPIHDGELHVEVKQEHQGTEVIFQFTFNYCPRPKTPHVAKHVLLEAAKFIANHITL